MVNLNAKSNPSSVLSFLNFLGNATSKIGFISGSPTRPAFEDDPKNAFRQDVLMRKKSVIDSTGLSVDVLKLNHPSSKEFDVTNSNGKIWVTVIKTLH